MKFSKSVHKKISQSLKSVFFGSFLLGVFSLFYDVNLPTTFLPELQQAPIQVATEKAKFEYEKNDQTYFAEPLYEYEIWGVIVSQNLIGEWWNVLNSREKDLCVVWGNNLKKDLSSIDFWSGNYTCYWRNSGKTKIDGVALSNNHLVTDVSAIRSLLKKTKLGDQIRMKGYLANYGDAKTGRVKRGTSTVRTDTGNGACETIFVEEFEILKSHWPVLRIVFLVNKYLFWILLLLNMYWLIQKRNFLETPKRVARTEWL